jgi:hypothetical protein
VITKTFTARKVLNQNRTRTWDYSTYWTFTSSSLKTCLVYMQTLHKFSSSSSTAPGRIWWGHDIGKVFLVSLVAPDHLCYSADGLSKDVCWHTTSHQNAAESLQQPTSLHCLLWWRRHLSRIPRHYRCSDYLQHKMMEWTTHLEHSKNVKVK